MKKLLVVLFSVLCCACGKTDRIFDIDTQLYPVALETVELTGEKLPIEILGGYGIKVFDSLLFVSTLNPDNFRDVYSLGSYSLLARLLRKGHANNEFLFNGYDGQCVEEDGCMNLYINDLNRQVFWKYNLTESVRQNKDCGEIIDVLPRHFLGAYYLAPHVFCYKNIMDDKCTYAIVDMAKHEVIEEFLVMNFVKERWQMDIPLAHNITKDNRVVVCYSLKINQLMLIDLKEKTRRSHGSFI